MISVDYHMHSAHSKDGRGTVLEMCESALGRGLREIGLTEHLDFDRDDPAYGFFDYPAYADAVAEARARYAGRLTIRMGLEFDFRRSYGAEVGDVLAGWEFDFRIGSVHSAAGIYLYRLAEETPADLDVRGLQAEYFAEVEALVASGWGHVIGHFDYLYKQLPSLAAAYRDAWYWRQVDRVLGRCIEAGAALEVNSHHILDRGLGLAADGAILRRYRALGGRRVTVGSDAHRPGDIAHGFADAERALRAAGFDAVVGFEGGRSHEVSILI